MRFNQAQVRDTIGISVETLRHWKRVLPPFSERKKYTLGDLLAAGVLHQLTDNCGVRVGYLSEISKVVVEVCNAGAWTSLRGKMLVIDVPRKTCVLAKSVRVLPYQDIVVVCPLESIMAQIQEVLWGKERTVAQHHLHFPPIAVRGTRAPRRPA